MPFIVSIMIFWHACQCVLINPVDVAVAVHLLLMDALIIEVLMTDD